MGRLLLIALRNLGQHKRRTLMLGGAIAGVTALLVLVLALSHGANEVMLRTATTVMTGHVNVGGFFKVTSGQPAPVVKDFREIEALIKKEVPEVDYVVARGRGWGRLVGDEGIIQVGITGIDIGGERGFKDTVRVVAGSLDDLNKPNALLLFEEQAKKLGAGVGDALTISAPTPRGVNNTVDVVLVAIVKDMGLMGNFSAFVNNEAVRSLYQLNDQTTGALQVYLHDIEKTEQVKEKLREVLAGAGHSLMADDPRVFWQKFETVSREGWVGQKLDVTTWKAETSFLAWTSAILTALGGLLVFVLVAIIAVGVMNALWIAIRERTREVGTLRAIGMQRRSVLFMFLAEGFLLGMLSTVAGALLGLGISAVINAAHVPVPLVAQLFLMSDRLHLSTTPGAVIGAVLFITFCTTFVSIFPSFLAARLRPVTAMHHIG